MWELHNIERRPAELDFSSAGRGRRSIAQLHSDGVLVANAVELTDWVDEVQLIVCEECGIVHCEPGGWVSLRRAGDLVVFGPDRRAYDETREAARFSRHVEMWASGAAHVPIESVREDDVPVEF